MTTARGAAEATALEELESRYRRVLRVFPGRYRREREEELLGVLLSAASPGQRRPSSGEAAALVVQAGRVWVRLAVSPDRVANHRAGSALSVLLPLVLLFPVARTVLSLVTLPWSFLVANRPDQGAWVLWGLAAVLAVVGPAGLGRWPAVAGTVWFGGVLAWGAVTGQTGIVSAGFGYLAVQITACCLMADPQRVCSGRELLRPYWWLALIAGLAVVAMIGVPGMPNLFIGGVYWPLALGTAAILTGLLLALRTPTGRALITVCGALFGAFVAGHGWWTGIGSVGVFLPASNLPDTATLLWLPGLPLLIWVVLRLTTAIVSRKQPSSH